MSWDDNLVKPASSGHAVMAARPNDADIVHEILRRCLGETRFKGQTVDLVESRRWIEGILASPLWLVLLLMSPDGRACGLSICQYGAYEVDLERRILKCRHLFVESSEAAGLRSLSLLLVDAVIEAGRRSPKVIDVFFITLGAVQLDGVRALLGRRGLRRIGTQHLGMSTKASIPAAFEEVHGMDSLPGNLLHRLRQLTLNFFRESARAGIRPHAQDPDRLIGHTLARDDQRQSTVLLAFEGKDLVGFIAGQRACMLPLDLRVLQSSFFYVEPSARTSAAGRHLFHAFSHAARRKGLDGVYLGTSSEIKTERVCRLMSIQGYAHCADVLALRLWAPDRGRSA